MQALVEASCCIGEGVVRTSGTQLDLGSCVPACLGARAAAIGPRSMITLRQGSAFTHSDLQVAGPRATDSPKNYTVRCVHGQHVPFPHAPFLQSEAPRRRPCQCRPGHYCAM